jgi:hypothetical protein
LAIASCAAGGHDVWWIVEAESGDAALAILPHYLAQRCDVVPVHSHPRNDESPDVLGGFVRSPVMGAAGFEPATSRV